MPLNKCPQPNGCLKRYNSVSRLEKISFIKSYWTFKNVYERLEDYTDNMLDSIIHEIISEMRQKTEHNAIDHVLNAPVFLN